MSSKTIQCCIVASWLLTSVVYSQEAGEGRGVESQLEAGYRELRETRWVDTGRVHDQFFGALMEALATGGKRDEAAARLALGRLRLRVPDGLGALAYFELARDVYRELGDPLGEVEAEEGIGEAYAVLGMLSEARTFFERARAQGRGTEDSGLDVEARALSVVSRMFVLQGAYDEGIRHLERVHDLAQRLEDDYLVRKTGLELGDLYIRIGRNDEALEILLQIQEKLYVSSPQSKPVEGEAIRDLFSDLLMESDDFGERLREINLQVATRMIEASEAPEDREASESAGFSGLLSEATSTFYRSAPTIHSDQDFADRRLAIGRQIPFGTHPNEPPPGITPTIRDRVVTSFRILEPLVDNCRRLHERHLSQVRDVKAQLELEIPGLSEYRRCSAQVTKPEGEPCSKPGILLGGNQIGFWDLEPPWPSECGEQPKEFDPQAVAEISSSDLSSEEESWEDTEQRFREKYPELASMTVDELIAEKKSGLRRLFNRGEGRAGLKDVLIDKLKQPYEILELQIFKVMLEIREQGLMSAWAEVGTYWHIHLFGSLLAGHFQAVEENHSETIDGICQLAFEAELHDLLGRAWTGLGPSYAGEAGTASQASWEAQEPLWEGLDFFGFDPTRFAALQEIGSPSLVFEGCLGKNRWLWVNPRQVALWRARLSLEEENYPLAAALFFGAWKGSPLWTRGSEPELEIEALIGLGETFARQELPAIAAIYYQLAIGLVESIQGAVREEQMTMSFADAQAELYGRMVDLLFEMDEEAFTFEYFGRAQARAFLDLIGNHRLDLRGVPEEINQRWQELRAEIAENQQLRQEISPGSFSGSTELRDLRKRGDELEARQAHLLNELRRHHPGAASFVSLEPVPIESLSGFMVEPETSVVAYFLTPTRGLAWVIEQGSSELVELKLDPTQLEAWVEEARDRIALRETPEELLETLYDKLVSPLADKIRHRRLIVVPHGVLHQIPFAALRDSRTGRYLVESHSVTLLPSATVMSYVQDRRNPWEERALAVGNPDGSLPASASEAERIAAYYGAEPLLGAAARESTVRSAAGQLDVLHVAAHGRFSEERPLAGYLALAPGTRGDPRDDGRLEVIEILNEMDFEGANLVVLSACNSSVGKQNRGDDIVSMPRALLYAGCPSVISSLWSIDDRASAQLMASFHRHLQRDGQGAAEALQAAQIDLLGQSATASPYYWAAFTLTGDQISRGTPPERLPGENPWSWDPLAEQETGERPPPFEATEPAVLPWTRGASKDQAQELLAEGESFLAERWAYRDGLAYPLFHQALASAERSGDLSSEAAVRLGLAQVRARAGDAAGALAHVDLAEAIYKELDEELGLVLAERTYAEAWRAWGDLSGSRWAFEKALELGAAFGAELDPTRASIHEDLAEVLELEGAYGRALLHLEMARDLWETQGVGERGLFVRVAAGELLSSLSRDERAVTVFEEVHEQLTTLASSDIDPAIFTQTLSQLASLSANLDLRLESWRAHSLFDDPFIDWPEPPTARDSTFTQRRREYLTDLPRFPGEATGELSITTIHHQFAMSPAVFMRLIRDCAFLHKGYGNDVDQLRQSSELFQAYWPRECGPRSERFDPRRVEHTLTGAQPDGEKGPAALAGWRRERENRADEGSTQEWGDASARSAWALQTMQEIERHELLGDPSLLLSDKKIVYFLLGASFPPDFLARRSTHLEGLDQLCRQDLAVRAFNALWRSYSRLGEDFVQDAEVARQAAWLSAKPLWEAWRQLGWVSSPWATMRDTGLSAPVFGSCRRTNRGLISRHEMDIWRAHDARQRGQSALARALYQRATNSGRWGVAPRPATWVSAFVGLAGLHADEGRPGLASLYLRKAIERVESVSEGFRNEELAATQVDIGGIYRDLNCLLRQLGEDSLEFSADYRDSHCPDRFVGDAPTPTGIPDQIKGEREDLCRDLVTLHNREFALGANPLTIAGYQGAGNNLESLRRRRISLEKGLRQLDYELRFPESHDATQSSESSETTSATAQVVESVAEPDSEDEEGRGRLSSVLSRSRRPPSERGRGRFGRLGERIVSAVADEAIAAVKRQGRLLRSRRRSRQSRQEASQYEGVLGVTLFQRKNYQGLGEKFTEDDASLKDNVIMQDLTRSVRIDPGCRVTLYEDANFSGVSTTIRNDVPSLLETLVGRDTVSSLRVECR